MKKEIIFRITRITITILFLIISTIFKQDISNVYASNINFLNDYKKIKIKELSKGINLQEAYPLSDNIGMLNDGYKFKIEGQKDQRFTIYLNNEYKNIEERIPNKSIRYIILKDNEILINPTTLNSEGILFTDTIDQSTYELKMWISEDATNEVFGKYFLGKIAL